MWNTVTTNGAHKNVEFRFVPEEPPSTVTFSWPNNMDFSDFTVQTWAIQQIRRTVPLYNETSENKIAFIKLLRALYVDLTLKQAKDVAEWFMANFLREAFTYNNV